LSIELYLLLVIVAYIELWNIYTMILPKTAQQSAYCVISLMDKTEQQGSLIHWRRFNDTEFDEELRKKSLEEATEVVQQCSGDEQIAELGDYLK